MCSPRTSVKLTTYVVGVVFVGFVVESGGIIATFGAVDQQPSNTPGACLAVLADLRIIISFSPARLYLILSPYVFLLASVDFRQLDYSENQQRISMKFLREGAFVRFYFWPIVKVEFSYDVSFVNDAYKR